MQEVGLNYDVDDLRQEQLDRLYELVGDYSIVSEDETYYI